MVGWDCLALEVDEVEEVVVGWRRVRWLMVARIV